jgi:hypothetical protein
MIIYYLFILVVAVMPPKKGKRGSNRTSTTEAPLDTQEALAATMWVMLQELATLRQATPTATATLLLLLVLPQLQALSLLLMLDLVVFLRWLFRLVGFL